MDRIAQQKGSSLAALCLVALLVIPDLAIARQEPAPQAPAQDSQSTSAPKDTHDRSDSKSPGTTKDKPGRSKKARARRDRPGFYMGRQIAPVMSWQGVDWLFRETRIEEEQPEAMLDALKVPVGATVADVGAGAGYHSIRLAKRVGPKGKVLASDLQPEMLEMLVANARSAGATNIKPIRATQNDTKLPEAAVDLILMVDVYHECTNPETTLKGLFKALKPGGRLVLVEFRGEVPEIPILPEHKMTLKQVRREVEPRGFHFKESLEFLPWQHVIIFEKPAEPKPDGKATSGPAAKSVSRKNTSQAQ
jgi:ubiquinone/menaquinone biosynthesis C-methylase UbiE